MASALAARSAVTLALSAALLCLPQLAAQSFSPEMQGYVQLKSRASLGIPDIQLINISNVPLAAATWNYDCREASDSPIDDDQTADAKQGGKFDAVAAYKEPLRTGSAVPMFRLGAYANCRWKVTALIFADGTEIGDQDALSEIHECRAVEKEEFDRLLQDEAFDLSAGSWNPARAMTLIQQRLDEIKNLPAERTEDAAARDCRIGVLEGLFVRVRSFTWNSRSERNAIYFQQASDFLLGLQEWNDLLTAVNYHPTHLDWLIFPYPMQ